MSLLDVMAMLQKHHPAGAGVTPVTPDFSGGVTPEPAWIGVVPPVTPVTPHLSDARENAQIWAIEDEPSPAAQPAPPPPPAPAAPPPAPDVEGWRVLASAYHQHHFGCPICIAAGRGVRYGLRCGVGAALWADYDHAARSAPMPWQQQKGKK